jgi:hypothetical protein
MAADTRLSKAARLLGRRKDGLSAEDLAEKLGVAQKSELDGLILRGLRDGKLWLHRGRYFSKNNFKRAVKG